MVEQKIENTVIYCKEMVMGTMRYVPYFRVGGIAKELGYDENRLDNANRWISDNLLIEYQDLKNVVPSHCEGIKDLNYNTKFTTGEGVIELLSKTRKFKTKADELKLVIKSIYQLTRDITERLYVLKLEYELVQKDTKIDALTVKMDQQTLEIRRQTEMLTQQSKEIQELLKHSKSADEKLDRLAPRIIVSPPTHSKEEHFVLLHLETVWYYTIRAQGASVNRTIQNFRKIYKNLTIVYSIRCTPNSVSFVNRMRMDLKNSGLEVEYNYIKLVGKFTEQSLVNYISRLYEERLK
jgi:hypothetical protein